MFVFTLRKERQILLHKYITFRIILFIFFVSKNGRVSKETSLFTKSTNKINERKITVNKCETEHDSQLSGI